MPRVDEEIASHLDTAIASLNLADNLFNAAVVAGSDLAVFCTLNGGVAPRMHLGLTFEKFSNVRVIVRSAPRKYGTAIDLAQEVWTNLHAQAISDFVDVLLLESEPQYIGEIKDGQHMWQMTAQVHQNANL